MGVLVFGEMVNSVCPCLVSERLHGFSVAVSSSRGVRPPHCHSLHSGGGRPTTHGLHSGAEESQRPECLVPGKQRILVACILVHD